MSSSPPSCAFSIKSDQTHVNLRHNALTHPFRAIRISGMASMEHLFHLKGEIGLYLAVKPKRLQYKLVLLYGKHSSVLQYGRGAMYNIKQALSLTWTVALSIL